MPGRRPRRRRLSQCCGETEYSFARTNDRRTKSRTGHLFLPGGPYSARPRIAQRDGLGNGVGNGLENGLFFVLFIFILYFPYSNGQPLLSHTTTARRRGLCGCVRISHGSVGCSIFGASLYAHRRGHVHMPMVLRSSSTAVGGASCRDSLPLHWPLARPVSLLFTIAGRWRGILPWLNFPGLRAQRPHVGVPTGPTAKHAGSQQAPWKMT